MRKTGFVTGMIAGTVMGVGVSMMVNPIDERDKKRISKNASQMFTTIGAFADHVVDMYK